MTENFEVRKEGAQPRPRLSIEEWKAMKKAETDEAYDMIRRATEEVTSQPERFMDYLDLQSRLDRYSVSNVLLTYAQCPNATQLKDFDGWARERASIRKGEKGISLLEPREYQKQDGTTGIAYGVKKMFDISQTKLEKLKPGRSYDLRTVAAAMTGTCPVRVDFTDRMPGPDMDAYFNSSAQVLQIRKEAMEMPVLCRWLAGELSYIQLSLQRTDFDRKAVEFPARCVSYMVCRKYGIDPDMFIIRELPERWKQESSRDVRLELIDIRNALAGIHGRISRELNVSAREKDWER